MIVYIARLRAVAALVLLLAVSGTSRADSADAMKGLDEQVQEVKSDVLAIAAELRQLEEKLLFPSETQLSVFVALDAEPEAGIDVDSVRVAIDGELVAHHIYTFKEVQALQRGGVQRLYTGNLPTGSHHLEVSLAGRLPGGASFERSQRFAFEKAVEPKVVGLTVGSADAEIRLGDW